MTLIKRGSARGERPEELSPIELIDALRIAFKSAQDVLMNIGWLDSLFTDNPGHTIDTNGLQRLRSCLRRILPAYRSLAANLRKDQFLEKIGLAVQRLRLGPVPNYFNKPCISAHEAAEEMALRVVMNLNHPLNACTYMQDGTWNSKMEEELRHEWKMNSDIWVEIESHRWSDLDLRLRRESLSAIAEVYSRMPQQAQAALFATDRAPEVLPKSLAIRAENVVARPPGSALLVSVEEVVLRSSDDSGKSAVDEHVVRFGEMMPAIPGDTGPQSTKNAPTSANSYKVFFHRQSTS